MSDEDSRIIVDEDWKARVQREKEEAAKAEAEKPESSPEDPTAPQRTEAASFEALISGLTVQAMVALGMMAPRDTKEVVIDLVEAKYVIDMLMVLRDKTKGNLTPQEQGYLAETLAQLQQGYVVRSQQLQEAALRGAGPGPERP